MLEFRLLFAVVVVCRVQSLPSRSRASLTRRLVRQGRRTVGHQLCLLLLPELAEPERFFFIGEHGGWDHAREDASVIATFLTAPPALDGDEAIVAEGAREARGLRLLMRAPKKLSAAEADDAAVITNVLLAGFGWLLTDVAEL